MIGGELAGLVVNMGGLRLDPDTTVRKGEAVLRELRRVEDPTESSADEEKK